MKLGVYVVFIGFMKVHLIPVYPLLKMIKNYSTVLVLNNKA